MQYLQDNYDYWRHLLEKGVISLAEIEALEVKNELNHISTATTTTSSSTSHQQQKPTSNYFSTSPTPISASTIYSDSNKNITKANESQVLS